MALIDFPSRLSLQERKHLVKGFIGAVDVQFPLDMVKLCVDFYNEIIHWNVSSNKLSSLALDEEIASNIVDSVGFKFQFILRHRVSQHTKKSIYSKYIKVLSSPLPIQSVVVYIQTACTTTNSKWKVSREVALHDATLPLSQQNTVGYVMKSDVDKHKTISFESYIKVLRIHLQSENDYKWINLDRYLLPMAKMQRESNMEYTLDIEYLLSIKMRQAIFSPNCANDIWCIQIKPWTRKTEPNCLLAVRLLVLPQGIRRFKADVRLSNSNGFCKRIEYMFSYDTSATGMYMTIQQMIGGDATTSIDMAVTCTAQISITELYDMNNTKIPKPHWKYFGVY
eukprot:324711_1